MDEQRFDDLTRALAAGLSRRAILRRIGTGIAGFGLLGAGRGVADAAPSPCNVFCADQPGPRGAQCRQTCKACAGGPEATCFDASTNSFTCLDIDNDASHCGGCGLICEAPYSACSGGECVCPAGTLACSSGGCLEDCGFGAIPNLLTCTCLTCDQVGSSDTCGDTAECQSGQVCANGCCCLPAGSLDEPCGTPNQPSTACCSGMCGPDGYCA